MDNMIIDGKQYEVSGYTLEGTPVIKADSTSSQDGYDEAGNPKISVQINVPSAPIGAIPGEVQ